MPAMGAVAPNDVFGRQPVANARAADNDDDSSYPRLNSNGKFIPHRRIVHLDLKGGAFKVSQSLRDPLVHYADMIRFSQSSSRRFSTI